jgi:hypothetical protein
MSNYELAITVLLVINALALLVIILRQSRFAKSADPKPPAAAAMSHLSPVEQQQLEQTATAAFKQTVDSATAQFGEDLHQTSGKLNQLIVRLTTEVVERELEQYRQSLATARSAALDSLTKMQQAVEERQNSLQSDLDTEVVKRRDYLIQRLELKLGEAVSAYIVESLGQGADLGAQRSFLLDSLERHKAELKKEFADEVV